MTCTLLFTDAGSVHDLHDFTDQSESRLCHAADSRLTAHLAVIATCVMLSPVPAQPGFAPALCKAVACM